MQRDSSGDSCGVSAWRRGDDRRRGGSQRLRSDSCLDGAKALLDHTTLTIKGGIEVCNDTLLLSSAELAL